MIFRLKIVIPLLVLCAAVFAVLYAVRGGVAKRVMQQSWPGSSSRLVLDNVHLKLGRELGMKLENGKVTEPAKGDRTLLGWKNASVVALSTPVGFGRLYVEEIAVDGLEAHSGLFDMSAAPGGEAGTGKDAGASLMDFDFKKLDHREILSRLTGKGELESEKKAAVLQKDAEESVEKWKRTESESSRKLNEIKDSAKAIQDKVTEQKTLDEMKAELEAIKAKSQELSGQKFDVKNVAQMKASLEQVKELKNRVQVLSGRIKEAKSQLNSDLERMKALKGDFEYVKKLKDEAENDFKRLRQEGEDVRTAAKGDAAMLKKELDPGDFGVGKITRILFGREWEEKLMHYLSLWDRAQGYITRAETEEEKAKKEMVASEKRRAASKDLPVEYHRKGLPAFTICELRLSSARAPASAGQGGDIVFGGRILNMSSDERLLGRPLSWEMDGKLGDGAFTATGVYSTLEEKKAERRMRFTLQGVQMAGREMGPPDVRVVMNKGVMRMDMDFDASMSPLLKASGSMYFENQEISLGQGVKEELRGPLQEAVSKILSKPLPFDLEYLPRRMPRISFRSDLDDVLKDAFKGYLRNRVSVEEEKLAAGFDKYIEERISAQFGPSSRVMEVWNRYGQEFVSNADLSGRLLGSGDQAIQGRAGELNRMEGENGVVGSSAANLEGERQNLEKQLLEQARQEAENEAKKRAEEEARKLIQQQTGQPQAEPGKSILDDKKQELEKLKNKLKF